MVVKQCRVAKEDKKKKSFSFMNWKCFRDREKVEEGKKKERGFLKI